MPRKKIATNSSLGNQLIKSKQKKAYTNVGEGPGGRGFKVVSEHFFRLISYCCIAHDN